MTLNDLLDSKSPEQAMTHEFAHRCHAVDRYLMGELSLEESQEFEEHLFCCPICANDVQTGAVAIDNLKEVLPDYPVNSSGRYRLSKIGSWNWLAFFPSAVLVPASLVLAAIVGYQNLVSIPALTKPQVLSSTVIAPVARESAPVIPVDSKQKHFNLNFEVDSPSNYGSYSANFQHEDGRNVLTLNSGPEKVGSFTLSFLLPAKSFPAGNYVMILRPVSDPNVEAGRYNFTIRNGGN